MHALRKVINPDLDNVSDAPRVMRLPCTLNHKDAQRHQVRVIHWQPERRFNPGDFDLILTQCHGEDREDRADRDDACHPLFTLPPGGMEGVAPDTGTHDEKARGPREEGTLNPQAPQTEQTERAPDSFSSLCTPQCHPSSLSPDARSAAEDAIRRTQPSGVGERNKCLFLFARALKGIPELAGRHLAELVPEIRAWHRRASPHIGTKPFEATLADFGYAWKRVIVPLGANFMCDVLAGAAQISVPESVRGLGEKIELLARVCVELQRRAGAEPFWLGCRSAAKLLGMGSHDDANRLIHLLLDDFGFLKLVIPGTQRKAARYRLAEAGLVENRKKE